MTPLEHIMGLMDHRYPEPIRRSMAQGILDKHAHDLAERQRATADDSCNCGGCVTVRGTANVIEPKSQRPSVQEAS